GTMPDYAELNGTQGTSSWTYSISPGTCKYQCQTGYHTENGGTTCTSDTQSCVISNATAEQTWNGSSWGTCTVVTCNANYTQSGNSCNINTYIVSGSFGANAAGATISVCGTNVTADGSGNFSTTRNHGSTCNNISATRSEYTCTTSTNGPASLTSNTTNISGSCSLSSNTSCKGLYDGGNTTDGIYTIDPDGAGSISSFSTYCDMTNGGWTLVSMERASGTSVDGAVGAIGSFTSLNQTTSFKITDEAWKAIPFTIGTKIVREDGIIYYVKYGSFPWSSSLDTGVNPGTGNNPIPSCSINGTSWVAGRYYHIADCYNAYRTEDIYSYGAGRASINCSYSFTDTHKYLACKNRTTIGNSGNNRTAWVK
ncbi:MAG: fibrinogen-like YCDxxxxGGGW domain-containing protein, partial [Candidatus Gracilibacteria bacterium]|nr:fibrinogen-like YCDxxxxGGGW domain-containing protein [Candidatus Gracilibacteria bacterium]